MKFKKEREYNHSLESIIKLFFDNDDEVYNMDQLENVTQWKVIKEEDLGDRRVGIKEWCAHAQIPKALQHIVAPKMLTWYEHSEWNRTTHTYRFRIEPFFFKKQVKCKGQTEYLARGENTSARIFEIDLIINIPVFGPMFEKLIMDHLRKNEEQDFKFTVQIAQKHLK
jgi:hypothetical protein